MRTSHFVGFVMRPRFILIDSEHLLYSSNDTHMEDERYRKMFNVVFTLAEIIHVVSPKMLICL